MADTKHLEKCGFLALLVMLITGTLLGLCAVVLAHFLTKYFADYYLIVLFPLAMAIILGFGLSLGAKIGRCTRFNIVAALLVLLFSIGSYGLLLFLNDYYEIQDPKPVTIIDEYFLLAEEVQNLLGELPYISDYISPVENSERGHIGTTFMNFFTKFPELAQQQPVEIGKIFDLAIFTPVREYLISPGITEWEAREEGGRLVFDATGPVQPWMLWSGEFLLIFVVALLMTRGGANKALRRRMKQVRGSSLRVDRGAASKKRQKKPEKEKKPKKKKEKKASPTADVELAPELMEAGTGPSQETGSAEEPAEKKKKKGFSLFGWTKKKKAAERTQEATGGSFEMTFPEDEARYALILHQFDPSRESDLVQMIQQIGQIPEERARRLLKVPSLIKRDISAEEARVAIERFNQLQAQVKLITMEQLLEIQKRQQKTVPPAPPSSPSQPAQASATPPPSTSGGAETRYALILKSFEPSQRTPILELLASLSGKPVDQLQQTLKPPALILRDATKDEVTMIAQQFQALQAEVKSLTMAELQKLMAKSKQR